MYEADNFVASRVDNEDDELLRLVFSDCLDSFCDGGALEDDCL